MNGFAKALTAILGIIAVIACLTTIGIIGYTATHGNIQKTDLANGKLPEDEILNVNPVPTQIPAADPNATATPVPVFSGHIHDYKETIIQKVSCLEPGQVRYACSCGDSYTVDLLATGHLPNDEWEIEKEPTSNSDGSRIKRCLYCNEIVEREILPATKEGTVKDENGNDVKHEHLYVATTEREATCVMAGLRKHTCSCGSFYTESIPAVGHVPGQWTETVTPDANTYGIEVRTCSVCGAQIDIRYLPALTPSPDASASSSASATPSSAPSSSASKNQSSPTPSPTPHVHQYTSYVVTPATCTEKGVRCWVCSCGDTYSESIELNPDAHHYEATFVAPTRTQQGYTIYTCTRCNFSYKDNYIMALTNDTDEE